MMKLRKVGLYIAAFIVAILLSGIDVTKLVPSEKDAFFAALYKRDAALVEEMLQDNPALLEEKTAEGESVFIYTVKYSDEEMFNLLREVSGTTPWESVDPVTTRTLLELADTYGYTKATGEQQDVEDAYYLHDAIERMSVYEVEIMINEGVDPNITDESGNTGLMKMLMQAQKELPIETLTEKYNALIYVLLNAGADPAIPNDAYETAWTILQNDQPHTILQENKEAWLRLLRHFDHEPPMQLE